MTAPNPYDTYQGSQQQYSYSTGYNPTQTSATTFVPHQGVAVSYQESTGTTRTTNYNDPPVNSFQRYLDFLIFNRF